MGNSEIVDGVANEVLSVEGALVSTPPTRDFSHTQGKGCDFEIGLCSSSHAKEQQCSSSEIANPRFTESG